MNEKVLIEHFIDYVMNELSHDKNLNKLQLVDWKVEVFKITIHFADADKKLSAVCDPREIEENRSHFSHLLENIKDQLNSK